MKITTYSGTVYEIKNIREVASDRGNYFKAEAARISDHPITYVGRFRMEEKTLGSPDFSEIVFTKMPEVGRGFHYVHEVWGRSVSSQVQKIEE